MLLQKKVMACGKDRILGTEKSRGYGLPSVGILPARSTWLEGVSSLYLILLLTLKLISNEPRSAISPLISETSGAMSFVQLRKRGLFQEDTLLGKWSFEWRV